VSIQCGLGETGSAKSILLGRTSWKVPLVRLRWIQADNIKMSFRAIDFVGVNRPELAQTLVFSKVESPNMVVPLISM